MASKSRPECAWRVDGPFSSVAACGAGGRNVLCFQRGEAAGVRTRYPLIESQALPDVDVKSASGDRSHKTVLGPRLDLWRRRNTREPGPQGLPKNPISAPPSQP